MVLASSTERVITGSKKTEGREQITVNSLKNGWPSALGFQSVLWLVLGLLLDFPVFGSLRHH